MNIVHNKFLFQVSLAHQASRVAKVRGDLLVSVATRAIKAAKVHRARKVPEGFRVRGADRASPGSWASPERMGKLENQ